MTEPRIYQERESKLVALARLRFANPLSPGELRLIRNSVRPVPAPLPILCDEEIKRLGKTPYTVRGSMLRWIVNEQEAATLIDPNGLFIANTQIDEMIDFSDCKLPFPVTFNSTLLVKGLLGASGSFKGISIENSEVQDAVNFNAATITSNVDLSSSEYLGTIDFTGARVSGDMYCQASTFRGEFVGVGLSTGGSINFNEATLLHMPNSISLDVANIGGELFMGRFPELSARPFTASGLVKAPHLRVGQDIHAAEGHFDSTQLDQGKACSLLLMAAEVQGLADFSGASFASLVSLSGARVQEDLMFQKARFCGIGKVLDLSAAVIGIDLVMPELVTSGSVEMISGSIKGEINCSGATLKGATFSEVSVGKGFHWWNLPHATDLNLSGSTLQQLVDDERSWPAPGGLNLAGAIYNTLEPLPQVSKSEEVRRRILWLERQSEDHVNLPQPWQQLAAVFESRGNKTGAKHVLYAYSRTQALRGRWIARAGSYIFDKVEEEPLRIAVPISLFWGLGAVVFWRAQRMGKMAPTERTTLERFSAGEDIKSYPRFHPIAYALENVLPVIKLGQDAAWAPNPACAAQGIQSGWRRLLPQVEYRWLVRLRWTLIIAGWMMALILAGTIGSRFK